jgi:hypothetical protein
MRLPQVFNTNKALARSLLEAGKGIKAVLQRAGTREAGQKPCLPNDKPSVQPPAKRIAGADIGQCAARGKLFRLYPRYLTIHIFVERHA